MKFPKVNCIPTAYKQTKKERKKTVNDRRHVTTRLTFFLQVTGLSLLFSLFIIIFAELNEQWTVNTEQWNSLATMENQKINIFTIFYVYHGIFLYRVQTHPFSVVIGKENCFFSGVFCTTNYFCFCCFYFVEFSMNCFYQKHLATKMLCFFGHSQFAYGPCFLRVQTVWHGLL